MKPLFELIIKLNSVDPILILKAFLYISDITKKIEEFWSWCDWFIAIGFDSCKIILLMDMKTLRWRFTVQTLSSRKLYKTFQHFPGIFLTKFSIKSRTWKEVVIKETSRSTLQIKHILSIEIRKRKFKMLFYSSLTFLSILLVFLNTDDDSTKRYTTDVLHDIKLNW